MQLAETHKTDDVAAITAMTRAQARKEAGIEARMRKGDSREERNR